MKCGLLKLQDGYTRVTHGQIELVPVEFEDEQNDDLDSVEKMDDLDAPIVCGEEEREDMEMEVDVDSFWIGSDSDEDFNEESGDVEDIGKAILMKQMSTAQSFCNSDNNNVEEIQDDEVIDEDIKTMYLLTVKNVYLKLKRKPKLKLKTKQRKEN